MQIHLMSSGIKSQHKFHRRQNSDYLQQRLQQISYNKLYTTPKKNPSIFLVLFLDTIETLLKPFISLQLLIIRIVIISTALPWGNMPVHDFPKDGDHGVIIKFINGDHVEVSQEARGHRVPATTWWAHGSHDLDVNQLHGCGFLQVIPVPVIQPLS